MLYGPLGSFQIELVHDGSPVSSSLLQPRVMKYNAKNKASRRISSVGEIRGLISRIACHGRPRYVGPSKRKGGKFLG